MCGITGEEKKEIVNVDIDVQIYENKKEAEVAQDNAELAMKKAELEKKAKMTEVESVKAVAIREAELQIEVEKKNSAKQKEKLKSEQLSQTIVKYEIKVQETNWVLYQKQKQAEVVLYEQLKVTEAQKAAAEATFFTHRQEADGQLYSKKKEAEEIVALGEAQGLYLRTLLDSLGGNYQALRDYLMINGGLYKDMARTNADAVKGRIGEKEREGHILQNAAKIDVETKIYLKKKKKKKKKKMMMMMMMMKKKEEMSDLIGFTNSDYTEDLDDRKRTSNYVFMIGFGAISWLSKKRHIGIPSTTEAEFVAALQHVPLKQCG